MRSLRVPRRMVEPTVSGAQSAQLALLLGLLSLEDGADMPSKGWLPEGAYEIQVPKQAFERCAAIGRARQADPVAVAVAALRLGIAEVKDGRFKERPLALRAGLLAEVSSWR